MGISTAPLKQALHAFDAGTPAREAAWERAATDADCDVCRAADVEALRQVREAFYAVTKDRNSHEGAMTVPLAFMRRIAAMDEI